MRWQTLVRICAGASALIALGQGVRVLDRESLAVGAALGAAALLTFARRAAMRRVGWIGVAALLLNQGFWMVGATVALTSAAPSVLGAAVPAALAVLAVAGLIASVARVRRAKPGENATPLAIGAFVIAVALTVAVPAAGANSLDAQKSDLRVVTRNLQFEPARLTAPAGDVGVVVTNEDLFWHTFTVNEFNGNVNVATGGSKRLVLEDVAPGTYEFVCAIPGHEGAGMKGVLVVR